MECHSNFGTVSTSQYDEHNEEELVIFFVSTGSNYYYTPVWTSSHSSTTPTDKKHSCLMRKKEKEMFRSSSWWRKKIGCVSKLQISLMDCPCLTNLSQSLHDAKEKSSISWEKTNLLPKNGKSGQRRTKHTANKFTVFDREFSLFCYFVKSKMM